MPIVVLAVVIFLFYYFIIPFNLREKRSVPPIKKPGTACFKTSCSTVVEKR